MALYSVFYIENAKSLTISNMNVHYCNGGYYSFYYISTVYFIFDTNSYYSYNTMYGSSIYTMKELL
jgi:hypothetical protein